jgi:hypothetical protein
VSQQAILLHPVSDPCIEYVAYGPYSMEQVLTVPSSQLIWLDQGEQTFAQAVDARFPCEVDDYCLVHSINAPRNNSAAKDLGLPASPRSATAIFRHPAFNSGQDDKETIDALYAEAKKRPVILITSPLYNRLRTGFVQDYVMSVDHRQWHVLKFDRARWEKHRATRKNKSAGHRVFAPGVIGVLELKQVAMGMMHTIRDAFTDKAAEDHWFRVDIKYGNRTKKETSASIVSIYNFGCNAFGKSFWTKAGAGIQWWTGGHMAVRHTAAEVASRWKKKKIAVPKDKLGAKVFAIVKKVARADAFNPGSDRYARQHRY